MTTICWDGKTLAADKRMNFGTEFTTVTKIYRVHDCLAGWAGDSATGRPTLAWYEGGAVPDDFPSSQRDRANGGTLIVIRPGGVIAHYGLEPQPMIIEDKSYTIGSGSPFASAAMHLGCDARRAVEVACALDMNSGNGIDTLTLESR